VSARAEYRRSGRTSKYAMSCLTIAFHATKRSMSTSDGRRSLAAVLLSMSERRRLTDVARLARETDVAREMDAESLYAGLVGARG
jgi:hypothetical protein